MSSLSVGLYVRGHVSTQNCSVYFVAAAAAAATVAIVVTRNSSNEP